MRGDKPMKPKVQTQADYEKKQAKKQKKQARCCRCGGPPYAGGLCYECATSFGHWK
jgi:hypothetical protein